MTEQLEILDLGFVLTAPNGDVFRTIEVKDPNNRIILKYDVFSKRNPYLWKTLEKFEQSGESQGFIAGKIVKYSGENIVVLQGEREQDAFEKVSDSFDNIKEIKRKDALDKIRHSEGYKTDLLEENAMSYSHVALPDAAGKIKFRYYQKEKDQLPELIWSQWFIIED